MECKRLECELNECKDPEIQGWYNYKKFLLALNKARNPKPKPDKKEKPLKVDELFSWYITISFNDKKVMKDGKPDYKLLVYLMKKFLNYTWVKSSDLEGLDYQLEQRSEDPDNIYGIHLHIRVKDTKKDKCHIAYEKGLYDGIWKHYVSDCAKIDVRPQYNKKGLDSYMNAVKKDPEKVKRQRVDTIIQQEFNTYIKDDMLHSNVINFD